MLKIRGVTKRLLALAVVFAMTCSVIPPQNAKATEADQPKQTETGGSAVTTQDESDSPTGTESLPAGETEEASADTAVSENAETPAVQYVYVENAYQVTPGVQNIAVSFQEGIALTNAVLTYEKEGTTERSQIAVSEIQQDAALFSIPYSDGSQSGIYRLVRVSAEVNGMSYEIDLGAIGLNIRYGVDQACDTQPDAVIDESTEAAAMSRSAGGAEAEVSFLTLDDNGEITENDTLAEAIEAAEDEAAPMGRSGKARTEETASVAKKTDDLVIVLDPGHGGPDPGTVRDDVYEKNLTLKIAGYCRDELKKYKGVTVYMTRDSDVSVSGTSDAAADLDARVNYAKQKKADVLISFHINSAGASAHGAEVYYPNSSYRPDIGSDGKALAQKIQDELVALGLYDRKIKYLNSQNNSTYDDGSIADYYGLIWRSKKAGFPGLIIEHAFISNTDDYNKYLSSDEKLKSLGQADARGIAEHFGLGKEEPAGWILSENRWWYRHSDGSYTTSDWEQINGRWYYFDTSGWMKTGWILLNGARYYLEASGAMATGWTLLDGTWYYLNASGAMATGWTWVNGKCYYLNDSGAMAADTWIGDDYVDGSGAWIPGKKKETDRWILSGNRWWYRHGDGSYTTSNWEQINGRWYYFDASGWMKTGWILLNGTWYYLEASGAMAAGWTLIGGTWYYLNASGAMAAGWTLLDGTWYYLNASGAMATGWTWVNGKCYYLNASGAMAADTWIGNDYVDGSGAWIPGKKKETDRWILSGNRWWYRHGDGSYTTSDWEQINGKWYYFDEAGWMKTGWLLLDGSWYYLDASGARAAGWVLVGGTYYYLDASGVMQVGWLEEGGSKYYLNTQGNSFGAEGSMAVGYREIEGQWYFFNKQRSPMGALYYTGVTPIMGACALGNDVNNVVNKMADQFTKSGKTYPGTALSKGGAPDIHTFCRIIYEEAVTEGVRPEVVFAQAMLETGYLQFGGDVKVGQFNFAGLGATGGGAEGIHFPDVRTGIRAQVQHLKAYASDEPLKQACVDERFKYVVRKSAPYIEWLGIQENPTGKGWAGGKEYGFNMIKNIINPLLS